MAYLFSRSKWSDNVSLYATGFFIFVLRIQRDLIWSWLLKMAYVKMSFDISYFDIFWHSHSQIKYCWQIIYKFHLLYLIGLWNGTIYDMIQCQWSLHIHFVSTVRIACCVQITYLFNTIFDTYWINVSDI